MDRTAGSFFLRSSIPQVPELEPNEPASINTPIATSMKPATEAMTWQQQKDFGDPQGRKWIPLQAAIDATVTTADTKNSWLAQQANFPASAPPTGRRKPRGKAAASTTSVPHAAISSASAETTPPESSHNTDTRTPHKPTPKKTQRIHKKKAMDGNMAAPRESMYTPPHLRKRSSAKGPKVDSAIGLAAANGSPVASDQSKTTFPARLHSSLNGAERPPPSQPSLPTTTQEPAKPENGRYPGWDDAKPELPVLTKETGKARWPAGPGPYKKIVWPKNRDMKYIPHSDSDGGVSFKSNSNGDPYYDVKKLLDWNGDWMPAPESWSARKGHSNRHFGEDMEQWMNTHTPECRGPMITSADAFRGLKTADGNNDECILVAGVCKELVPRYWLEAKVDSKTLRDFWKELPQSAPEPVSETDLTDAPWWECYEDEVYEDEEHRKFPSCYLNGLAVPEANVDPSDEGNRVPSFKFASAEDKLQDMEKRRTEKTRRTMARRNRPIPESKFPIPQMEDRRLRPAANIYIRPVQPADVRGIAELYNYYVEKTIYAIEFDGRTETQIRDRINDSVHAGLPYLVAISKANPSKLSPGYVNEKIVGYVSLDDYCDQSSMYRFTFEMELFVHPGFLRQGVGSCLLDRVLEMANTGYNARGGYEYINKFDYLKTGPARVIKTIVLNVHHKSGEDPEWQMKFLKAFKFTRKGALTQMGFKKEQAIDVAIFQHHTSEVIDQKGKPTVTG
ncbi:hypothetical protein EJ02DRAFT_344468 [Clathrospora elynae]|uniref:N-acetyltransferase domain-containing protein n=1 Tax=Clathrospora elynae TaxID=706981 RepID=A0A6A5T1B6_9PLEO|nr:hypothetical protein EJ02DRAFT_344468 [Clathrospora elynae]